MLKLTKAQFFDLTPYEFHLLVDFARLKEKQDFQITRNVVYNAGANLMRKSNTKEIPLFEDMETDPKKIMDEEEKLNEREELFGDISI